MKLTHINVKVSIIDRFKWGPIEGSLLNEVKIRIIYVGFSHSETYLLLPLLLWGIQLKYFKKSSLSHLLFQPIIL